MLTNNKTNKHLTGTFNLNKNFRRYCHRHYPYKTGSDCQQHARYTYLNGRLPNFRLLEESP